MKNSSIPILCAARRAGNKVEKVNGKIARQLRHALALLLILVGLVAGWRALTGTAEAALTFGSGSLIIPMDTGTNGQNFGMLRAYGLVYELLRNNVTVNWVINPAKAANGDDFAVSVANALQDVRTGATVAPRSYRGGPFIIASSDAALALPIIQAWQAAAGDQTVVHRYLGASSLSVSVERILVSAPRIAVLKDGNETIAFNDLNAAGIRDSIGGLWSASSPDQLTEADVEGPTTTVDDDGALFVPTVPRLPRYSYLAVMHYNTTAHTNEVAQEVRTWLSRSSLTHLFAQCEGTRVFENAVGGLYLTNAGLDDDGDPTTTPVNRVPSHMLTQMDGVFEVDSGSVDSMAAKPAGAGMPNYKNGVTTLINESAAPLLSRIVLLTGRLDGVTDNGRVTYLAGHDYALDLPITSNPQTNGVRLFLNSIFASDAAATRPDADLVVTKTAPSLVNTSEIPYTITYRNPATNVRPAENIEIVDTLPAGATYVAGSGSPAPTSVSGNTLTWNLPPLAPGQEGTVTFRVSVTTDGTYSNSAMLRFSTLTLGTVRSAPAVTVRDTVPPTVEITSYPGGDTNNTTPTFQFTTDGTAVTKVCSIDNVGFVPCSPAPASYTSAALPEGPHMFVVRVTDAAGNTATATRAFNVDTTPPVVTFAAPPINLQVTNSHTPRFYFSAVDVTAVTAFCRVAGDPFAQCTSPFTTRALPDGNYVVSVFGRDAAGNIGPTDHFSFTIDSAAPIVSIPVPPNQTTYDVRRPTFTFADVGPAGTPVSFQCHVDAAPDMACVSPFTVPADLANGNHTFTVTATDAAGNTGQGSLNFSVSVPITLVSIEVSPVNSSVPAGRTLQFTATGTFSDGTHQDLTASATWSSSSPTVAVVSNASGSQGLATGVAPGMTQILAQAGGILGSTTLTVTDAVLVSIEVTPANSTVPVGVTQQFTATGTFSDGSNRDLTTIATWSSNNTTVARVSNASGSRGLATAVSAGTAQITAQSGAVLGSTTLTVVYRFTGFFGPVSNLPGSNSVNSGQAIPIKFSLGGNKGLGIISAGYPISTQVTCGSTANGSTGTPTESSGGLTYDAKSDQYSYVWKTDKSWAGTCRTFTIKLNDGSMHQANFTFTK